MIVKGNRKGLHESIALCFDGPVFGETYAYAETADRRGNRHTICRLWATEALMGYPDWPGHKQVMKVERWCMVKGKTHARWDTLSPASAYRHPLGPPYQPVQLAPEHRVQPLIPVRLQTLAPTCRLWGSHPYTRYPSLTYRSASGSRSYKRRKVAPHSDLPPQTPPTAGHQLPPRSPSRSNALAPTPDAEPPPSSTSHPTSCPGPGHISPPVAVPAAAATPPPVGLFLTQA